MLSDVDFDELLWLIIPVIPMTKKASKSNRKSSNASYAPEASNAPEQFHQVPSAPTIADMFPTSGIFAARRTASDRANYLDDEGVKWDPRDGERADCSSNTKAAGGASNSSCAAYGAAFPPLPSLLVAPGARLVSPYSAAPSSSACPSPKPKPEPESKPDRELPSSSLSLSTSRSVGAIVNHLAKHGGWLPWLKLARDLNVSSDFGELRKWLLAQSTRDFSFTGKHPDWILPVFYEAQSAAQANGKPSPSTPVEVSCLSYVNLKFMGTLRTHKL